MYGVYPFSGYVQSPLHNHISPKYVCTREAFHNAPIFFTHDEFHELLFKVDYEYLSVTGNISASKLDINKWKTLPWRLSIPRST